MSLYLVHLFVDMVDSLVKEFKLCLLIYFKDIELFKQLLHALVHLF